MIRQPNNTNPLKHLFWKTAENDFFVFVKIPQVNNISLQKNKTKSVNLILKAVAWIWWIGCEGVLEGFIFKVHFKKL